jgi:hypothetical protein
MLLRFFSKKFSQTQNWVKNLFVHNYSLIFLDGWPLGPAESNNNKKIKVERKEEKMKKTRRVWGKGKGVKFWFKV